MSRFHAKLVLLLIATALFFTACGDEDGAGTTAADTTSTSTGTAAAPSEEGEELPVCEDADAPEPKKVNLPGPKMKRPTASEVVFETTCGEFTVSLSEDSPKTAASFQYLAEEGVFDDTQFHRVVPGFVIQGGDPAGDGTGGPGFSVDEKPPGDTSYTKGVVAMAKTGAEPPGRSGSQFFVVTGADAGLPPDFAVAGEVTEGIEVVEAIEALGLPGSEAPSRPAVIESATAK